MPRLSIILPHIFDEFALETTLLSILENRPQGSELIVAHVGDYLDPYQLDRDEIRLIEAPANAGLVEMLNASVREARGAILHTLLPSCLVEANWTASATAWFQDLSIGTVSPTVAACENTSQTFSGLQTQCLPRRAWSRRARRGESVIASLCGGFYRRQTIQALNGWIASSTREGAEAEMAMAMHALSMRSIAEPASRIVAPQSVIEGQLGGYALGNYAGKLAMAYSHIVDSSSPPNSIAARIGCLAGGLISPTSVAERLGWVMGISDRSLVGDVRARIETAESRLPNREFNPTSQTHPTRQAA